MWLTIATRSPWPTPRASSPAAWARASSPTRLQVGSPQDSRRLVGLVDDGHAIAVDGDGPVEEVGDGQRHTHAASLPRHRPARAERASAPVRR